VRTVPFECPNNTFSNGVKCSQGTFSCVGTFNPSGLVIKDIHFWNCTVMGATCQSRSILGDGGEGLGIGVRKG